MIEFEKLFKESKGQPIVVGGREYRLLLSINSASRKFLHVKFCDSVERPLQGLRIDSETELKVNGRKGQGFVFWRNSAPREFDIECSPNSTLDVRNVWDNGDGVEQSWHGGAAFWLEMTGETIRLHANSTLQNDKCEDMTVELSWRDEPSNSQVTRKSWLSKIFKL